MAKNEIKEVREGDSYGGPLKSYSPIVPHEVTYGDDVRFFPLRYAKKRGFVVVKWRDLMGTMRAFIPFSYWLLCVFPVSKNR